MKPKRDPILGTQMCFFFVPRVLVVITLLQECLPAPAAVSIHSSMCSPPLASLPRVWHHATFSARSLWDAYGGQSLSRSPASFPCTSGGARAFVALAPARVAPTRQWQPRVSATTTRSWGCVGPARTCPGAGGNASPALGPPRISAPPTWVLTPLCHVGQKMVHGCVGQLEAGTRLRTCTHHDLSNVFNEWGRGKDREAPATRTPNIS